MIVFEVIGRPVQQGSKSGFYNKHLGRVVMTDQNAKQLKPWREAVVGAALEQLAKPDVFSFPKPTPVGVAIEFRLRRPTSHTRKQRAVPWPVTYPDIDKLVRSILDGLTAARVFGDDSQVAALNAVKIYADDDEPEGAVVNVWELKEPTTGGDSDGVRRAADRDDRREADERGGWAVESPEGEAGALPLR